MSEHDQQAALIAWADLIAKHHPELGLLFAIPNAGKRPGLQGQWMREEGLRAGMPDLLLPVARQDFHGFFLELKDGDNRPSSAQQQRIEQLRAQGFRVEVYWSWPPAARALCEYLKLVGVALP